MSRYAFTMRQPDGPILGLIALQVDQTLEGDMRQLLPRDIELYVSRVPSAPEVRTETLARMEAHLAQAASLLPPQVGYDAIGYGCTSGTATIGADRVAEQVSAGAQTRTVTEPVSALLAACAALDISRLAVLSPYVVDVSATLRSVLRDHGVETPLFGSFEEAEEARVVRIDEASIIAAARDLLQGAEVEGLFLSCTNLRTLGVIETLERELTLPVLSSNLVLGWHLAQLGGVTMNAAAPGRLARMAL
jgi:maleate isomerase